MPRTVTELRVFVASPSDLQQERELLPGIIDEVNRTLQGSDVRLVAVRFEDDVSPGIGTDAQAVINEQIGDDYDIFLGMFWARFGTPTPRAQSGTQEEFERALTRLGEARNSIRILLYFKNAPIRPTALDPEQLAAVMRFKERASTQGIISSFDSAETFAKSVRLDLLRQAREYGSKWGPVDAPHGVADALEATVTAGVGSMESASDENDEGILDIAIDAAERTERAMAAMARMGEQLEALGNVMERRAHEISKVTSQHEPKKLHSAINLAADDMDAFVQRCEADFESFRKDYGIVVEALFKIASMAGDFPRGTDEAEFHEMYAGLKALHETITGAINGANSFKSVVAGFPRATTRLNRAKRNLFQFLDRITSEFEDGLRVIANTIQTVKTLGETNE